jgi:hypothetical protein
MSDDLLDKLYDRRVCSPAQNSCRNDWLLNQCCDRIEELEARVAAADKLAEAVTHEREMVCQDFGMQQDAATAVHNALAAYQVTKEGE